MITKTRHFVSKAFADTYCKEMGERDADRAIFEGRVFVGSPPIDVWETVSISADDGRYQIEFKKSI